MENDCLKHHRFNRFSWMIGVILHMIQAYELGNQDIINAQAQAVFALARVLGCSAEVICG